MNGCRQKASGENIITGIVWKNAGGNSAFFRYFFRLHLQIDRNPLKKMDKVREFDDKMIRE